MTTASRSFTGQSALVAASFKRCVDNTYAISSAAFGGNDGGSNHAGRPGSALHHAAAQDDNGEVLQPVVLLIDALSTAGIERRSPAVPIAMSIAVYENPRRGAAPR